MDNTIIPFEMFGEIMDLRMAIVASGNAIIGFGRFDLLIF
jgi:hypothetical protein